MSSVPAPSAAFRAQCDAKKAAHEAEKTARRHRHEEAFYDRRRARQDRADEAYEAALKREEKRNRKAAAQRAAAGAAPRDPRSACHGPPGGKRREEEAPPPPPIAVARTDLLATLGLTVIRDTHGVGHEPDTAAIKSAYRRLALRYHPDKNGGDPAACEAFKRIANAYERLTATTP